MSENKDSEIKDIIEGFNLFQQEKEDLINPIEVKEIMDVMNMSEKNPFLYNIITNLCSSEEIQQKGGISAEDFISLLDKELEDISSIESLQKIFSIFSDVNSNKISLPIFSQILNQYNDLDLGKDEENIKKLISKPEIRGKEIDFNEFQDIMNSENEKTNLVYKKKSSTNSKNKNNAFNENIINNNINYINNRSDNFKDSNSISENNLHLNNTNLNSINKIENHENIKENINNKDEINNNNIIDLNYDNDINNFDNVNPKFETKNANGEKSQSKKKYRHMHEWPKNKIEKDVLNDENKFDNQNVNNYDEKINNNVEEYNNDKEDKTEKRYHRRYRNIKSPSQKQKEEKFKNDINIEERTDNKVSTNYWRYRGKK